jgi:hypothetical protein
MYPYKLRQVKNCDDFMLEFLNAAKSENFTDDFLDAIAILRPELISKVPGLAVNDELILHYQTIIGEFYLKFDNRQNVFVSSNKEQLLLMIDSRLLQNWLFEKIQIILG